MHGSKLLLVWTATHKAITGVDACCACLNMNNDAYISRAYIPLSYKDTGKSFRTMFWWVWYNRNTGDSLSSITCIPTLDRPVSNQ